MSFKGAALDVLEAFGWFVVTERYFTVCALVFPHFYLFGAFVVMFILTNSVYISVAYSKESFSFSTSQPRINFVPSLNVPIIFF